MVGVIIKADLGLLYKKIWRLMLFFVSWILIAVLPFIKIRFVTVCTLKKVDNHNFCHHKTTVFFYDFKPPQTGLFPDSYMCTFCFYGQAWCCFLSEPIKYATIPNVVWCQRKHWFANGATGCCRNGSSNQATEVQQGTKMKEEIPAGEIRNY